MSDKSFTEWAENIIRQRCDGDDLRRRLDRAKHHPTVGYHVVPKPSPLTTVVTPRAFRSESETEGTGNPAVCGNPRLLGTERRATYSVPIPPCPDAESTVDEESKHSPSHNETLELVNP